MAAVQDEDLVEGELVSAPASFVRQLKASGLKSDVLTFPQKLEDPKPKHSFHVEWDNVAVIPITTFQEWWEKRIESSVRRAVRKAAKDGVVVRTSPLDDEFVSGIVNINNETPVRQGRRFWHFRKSHEEVKLENSTYDGRNVFLGAYYRDEMIGFLRMTYAGKVGNIVQLLSMMKHYDKRPANALIAKAVEVCAQDGMTHLMYYNYVYNDEKSSLTEFKRRNGFEKVLLPRYYVPLTLKGRLALWLGLHKALLKHLPAPVVTWLLKTRSRWYEYRASAEKSSTFGKQCPES
jgi:hypothetical protein